MSRARVVGARIARVYMGGGLVGRLWRKVMMKVMCVRRKLLRFMRKGWFFCFRRKIFLIRFRFRLMVMIEVMVIEMRWWR